MKRPPSHIFAPLQFMPCPHCGENNLSWWFNCAKCKKPLDQDEPSAAEAKNDARAA
jgi:hypothetical protein